MGCVAGVNGPPENSTSRFIKESPQQKVVRELWDSTAMLEIGFLNSFFSSIDFMQRCEKAAPAFLDDPDEVSHIFLEYGMKTEAAFFGNLRWIHVLSRIFELYQSEQAKTAEWCMGEEVFADYCRDYRKWIPARFGLLFEHSNNPTMRDFIQQHQILPFGLRVLDSIAQSIRYLTDNFTAKQTRSTVLDFVLSNKHKQPKIVLQDFLNFYITSSLAWDICEYMFHLHVCYLATEELCVPLGCYDENEESSIAPRAEVRVDNNPESDSENDVLILEESVNQEKTQIEEQKFCDKLIRSLAPREYNGWQKSRRSFSVNKTEDSDSDNSSYKESSPRSPSRVWFPKYHPARNANAKRRGYGFAAHYRTNNYEYKEPIENTVLSSHFTQTSVLTNPERSFTHLRPWHSNKRVSEFFSETRDDYHARAPMDRELKSPALEQIPGGGFMFTRAITSTPVSSSVVSEGLKNNTTKVNALPLSAGSSPYHQAERLLNPNVARPAWTFPPRSVSEPPRRLWSAPQPKSLAKSLTKSHRKETSIFVHEILGDCGDAPLVKEVKSIPKQNQTLVPRGIDCDDTTGSVSGIVDAKRGCSDEKPESRKRISLHLFIPKVNGSNTTSSSLDGTPKSLTSSLKSHLVSSAPLAYEDNTYSKRPRRSLGKDSMRQIPGTGTSGPTFV